MKVEFECPECRSLLAVEPKYRGERIDCPKCGTKIVVPSPSVEQFISQKKEDSSGGCVIGCLVAVILLCAAIVLTSIFYPSSVPYRDKKTFIKEKSPEVIDRTRMWALPCLRCERNTRERILKKYSDGAIHIEDSCSSCGYYKTGHSLEEMLR